MVGTGKHARALPPTSPASVTALPRAEWPTTFDDGLIVPLPSSGLPESEVQHLSTLVGFDLSNQLRDPAEPDFVADASSGIRCVPEVADPMRWGARCGRVWANEARGAIALPNLSEANLRDFVLGALRGCYTLSRGPTPPNGPVPPGQMILLAGQDAATAEQAVAVGRCVLFARDLANEPSNVKNPQWLAQRAAELSGGGLTVETEDADALSGFGGILAVGAGSASPPNLTTLSYDGGSGPHVVLVGKGITFDSGGLSIKPPASMPLMKTDMTGAAAVLGAVVAARDLGLPLKITALLACAENMPSGTAMRPGDIVRHYGGRTTEVLNTDAEGRLVLADALAHAAADLDPDYLIDLASLTGAATVGLGRYHAAMYSGDDNLAAALTSAGERSGDRVWRMPLVADYRFAIDSTVADAVNTNTDPHIAGGSITAALFLQPFAGGTRWAHIDIAGTARSESDREDTRKGATGYGVALLTAWLAALSGTDW